MPIIKIMKLNKITIQKIISKITTMKCKINKVIVIIFYNGKIKIILKIKIKIQRLMFKI